MTVRALRKAVAADLEALFRNDYFKTPETAPEEEWPEWLKELPQPAPDWHLHRMAAPKAYEQYLPLKTMDNGSIDPEAEDPFPYIIVRADKGGIEGPTAAHKADVILLIGIFDDDPKNQGQADNFYYGRHSFFFLSALSAPALRLIIKIILPRCVITILIIHKLYLPSSSTVLFIIFCNVSYLTIVFNL